MRSKFSPFGPLAMVAGLLLTSCLDFNAMAQEVSPAYIEPGYASRFYLGDEDTRLGWAHLVSGNYGLAEQHYRRAVEATRQNGSAWIGLVASYDRLGRFDLADLAYRHAIQLEGGNYVILNNWGYSYLLRGCSLAVNVWPSRGYADVTGAERLRHDAAMHRTPGFHASGASFLSLTS